MVMAINGRIWTTLRRHRGNCEWIAFGDIRNVKNTFFDVKVEEQNKNKMEMRRNAKIEAVKKKIVMAASRERRELGPEQEEYF